MTKKEFLKSRGYEYTKTGNYSSYDKKINHTLVCIYLITKRPTTSHFEVISLIAIRNQEDIDALQIAFNNVKRDFDEMMKCED